MADRLISVGDDLTLPPSVKVPSAQVTGLAAALAGKATAAQGAKADAAVQADATPAGLAVLEAADVTAQQSALRLRGATPPSPSASPFRPVRLTAFQGAHGWASHSATPIVNDTTTYMMGTQSVSVPAGASAQKTALSLDLTGRILGLWLRIEDLSKVATVLVYAGSVNLTSFFSWRVAAGADATPWFRSGEWMYVTLPFPATTVTGTPDRAAIHTLRVSVTGTGARIWVQAVDHLPDGRAKWPNGLVSLTFDDGYSSNLTAARRSMSPRGFAGTLYTIVDRVGHPGFLTEVETVELCTTHGWDIESHGLPDYTTLTDAQLRDEFSKTREWIASRGLGRGEHMAYPMGYNDERVVGVAREFFTTSRTISGHTRESFPPAHPQRLRSVTAVSSFVGGTSVATVKGYVDAVAANGGWLILVFHRITDTVESPMDCSFADLESICDYLSTSSVAVRTIAQAFA